MVIAKISPHHIVLDAFRRLRADWPARGWTFDNRFECVASSFDAEFAPRARELLAPVFPRMLHEATLGTASAALRDIANRTGGLRSTQLMFAADPVGHITPYGLWWPWEEAQRVSLRVGLDGASPAESQELCACFGIID